MPKIRIMFKTPDIVDDAIKDFSETEKVHFRKELAKWIKNGEYITIEFDTDEETAEVIHRMTR